MKINGNVEDIIFKNSVNGYTVLNIDYNGSLLTCVGKAININVGEDVELEGNFVKNEKFGEQFAFTEINVTRPKSLESIKKYLASGLIKGIGPVTAEAIVNKFKEDTLSILEYAPNKLSEVRGISSKKAIEIGEYYNEIKKMQEAVIFFARVWNFY